MKTGQFSFIPLSLMSKKTAIHHISEESGSIAISPLAIPILAGPGTIVTAMNQVTDADLIHICIVIFAIMILLTYPAFIRNTV